MFSADYVLSDREGARTCVSAADVPRSRLALSRRGRCPAVSRMCERANVELPKGFSEESARVKGACVVCVRECTVAPLCQCVVSPVCARACVHVPATTPPPAH